MPYFLERAEQVLDKQRYWVKPRARSSWATRAMRPTSTRSTSGRRSATTSTAASSRTATRLKSLDELGEDNVMCETDYPHSDSTWPNCIDVARDTMKDLPENVQYKLLRGNAERLYRFTPAEPPVLAKVRERVSGRTGRQERHRHRRRFRCRPGLRHALRARRARGSSSPTSTSTTRKRLCARSNRQAARPSPSASTCRTSSRCRR